MFSLHIITSCLIGVTSAPFVLGKELLRRLKVRGQVHAFHIDHLHAEVSTAQQST
jgi:hypothetical protein